MGVAIQDDAATDNGSLEIDVVVGKGHRTIVDQASCGDYPDQAGITAMILNVVFFVEMTLYTIRSCVFEVGHGVGRFAVVEEAFLLVGEGDG